MEDISSIYMPCWDCPYGHNCAYYKDSLWDQWILSYRSCPIIYNLPFSHVYEKAKEIKKDINLLSKKL